MPPKDTTVPILPSAGHRLLRCGVIIGVLLVGHVPGGRAQTSQPAQSSTTKLGGNYASLGAKRQAFVADWVKRFNEVTGQSVSPEAFYDDVIKLSSKTTFDAVTNALMTTQLTDQAGASLGNALDLVEQVEAVRGQLHGTGGDQQFRMYARLKNGAVDTLARSREFKRGHDNTVFHKGYPISYRLEGGAPSVQVSLSEDGRRADIDVDYRSSSFPGALFNGHLTAANSDVRAGDNFDRHSNRWAGFENWWRSFFGIRLTSPSDEGSGPGAAASRVPRVGRKNIDVMAHDFLQAWLVEGDVMAASAYVSERALSCLVEEGDDPMSFDRGLAPLSLMVRLKAAHDSVGARAALKGLIVGVRLGTMPELKVVTQPYHDQFVIYAVPDDVAAEFDCASRMLPAGERTPRRRYGNYFGTTFYIDVPGGRDQSLALLWARENGYWRIVSWRNEPEGDTSPPLHEAPVVNTFRIDADPTLVEAGQAFLDRWLVRKDYETAFGYLSPKSYACYNLFRAPDQPAAATSDEAGRRLRQGIERIGVALGRVRGLDAVVSAADPVHPALRAMNHQNARVFSLSALPDAFAEAADCSARARNAAYPAQAPAEYGNAFVMMVRFRTQAGEAPVLRTLWARESSAWRITAFEVDLP
jgi:hypothetical protein